MEDIEAKINDKNKCSTKNLILIIGIAIIIIAVIIIIIIVVTKKDKSNDNSIPSYYLSEKICNMQNETKI